eukprot:TRINITY_DN4189_c0_g1_i1.p1 TRINITY_DN4189_c0_g1~~TRINITY_DN4189_c0_g1_i1.p1  ORF type:complete len:403 (-),score=92.66 TRINITY_DN4189_c0_g1_i1:69-1277(-)
MAEPEGFVYMRPASPKPPSKTEQRIRQFEVELEGPKIDLSKIRAAAFSGIPEKPGLRAAYWKILLNYLPVNKNLWEETLQSNRSLYQSWVKDLMTDPHSQNEGQKDEIQDVTFADHPLSLAPDSAWGTHFKDLEIMGEIRKDVRRTFPHLHFFNKDGETGIAKHYDAILHILFLYAKLNPGVGYVQGMNEILAPIYYIFASDPNIPSFEAAEADTFFSFKNLMAEIMNNFCKTLDKSDVGITAAMKRLNDLLKKKDPDLWQNLESKGMHPQFYSFRWLTLLLSQEFELPDTLRLWDSLFSDPKRFDFLFYVCCAMMINVRDKLIEGDFAENLKLLQHFPPTVDMHVLIDQAEKLKATPDNSEDEADILVIEQTAPPDDPDVLESLLRKVFVSVTPTKQRRFL